jgi:hypothetical protein
MVDIQKWAMVNGRCVVSAHHAFTGRSAFCTATLQCYKGTKLESGCNQFRYTDVAPDIGNLNRSASNKLAQAAGRHAEVDSHIGWCAISLRQIW